MYDAFPYQQFGTFGGTVTRISRTALGPDEIAAPLSIDEPAYRIRVRLDAQAVRARSEEHTSELQSLMRISYAVFCLKKKKTPKQLNSRTSIVSTQYSQ